MTQTTRSLNNENPAKPDLCRELTESLEDLYRRVDEEVQQSGVQCWLSGKCCDFEKMDHTLYASSLEIAFLREKYPEPYRADSVLCPFWKEGLCVERDRRPLGCRTYFCDDNYSEELQAIYEKYHAEIKALAQRYNIPYSYEPFVSALRGGNDHA